MRPNEEDDRREESVDSVLDALADECRRRLDAGDDVDAHIYVKKYSHIDPQRIRDTCLAVKAMHRALPPSTAPAASTSVGIREPQVGDRIGDFQIIRRIASGGMGVVYEAEQLSLHRSVALKVLPFAALLDQVTKVRFRREVETVARLEHDNIVPVWAVGERSGLHYYAMRLIDGITAAQLVRQLDRKEDTENSAGEQDLEFARRIGGRKKNSAEYYKNLARLGVQAADAIEYAHCSGVVHRDIKPSNLLVDRRLHLWVTDFGLALVDNKHAQTLTGDLVGTPRYMSPEQILCKPDLVDYRTDIYSLGITLYELIALQPAFDDTDATSVLQRVSRVDPTPLRRLDGSIPKDLETIVHKAIEKEPTHRYRSAEDFAADLRNFIDDKTIVARRATPVQRALKWSRRNRQLTAVGALSTVFLILTAVVSLTMLVVMANWNQLVSQVQPMTSPTIRGGWRTHSLRAAGKAARIWNSAKLQTAAANTFAGLDATPVHHEPVRARRVAFHPNISRVSFGPVVDPSDGSQAIRTVDLGSGSTKHYQNVGDGPIGYRSDGTPLQISITEDRSSLVVIDLNSRMPMEPGMALPPGWLIEPNSVAINPDCKRVAALAKNESQQLSCFLWCADSRLPAHEFSIAVGEPTILTLSDDGAALAVATDHGDVLCWEVDSGAGPVKLPHEGLEIHCMCFGPDKHRFVDNRDASPDRVCENRVLAVSDSSLTITLWDIGETDKRAYYLGSRFGVTGLDFSPNGSLLAVCDPSGVRIFRTDSSDAILALDAGSRKGEMRFSHDGQQLAIVEDHQWGGRVSVFELSKGRGIRTLYGLRTPVSTVCLSSDVRYVAALSHGWEVGIWDLKTAQLVHILHIPPGRTVDNAAMAFSPDNEEFAVTTGRNATIWSMVLDEARTISLRPGIADMLAYHEDALLSLRFEPSGEAEETSWVLRLRNLRLPESDNVVKTIRDFAKVQETGVSPKGDFFVVDGIGGNPEERRTYVYDAAGTLIDPLNTIREGDYGIILVDPAGTTFAVALDRSNNLTTYQFGQSGISRDRELRGHDLITALGPGAELFVGRSEDLRPNFIIYRRQPGELDPLVSLGAFAETADAAQQFSADGSLLVLGSTDGRVFVCNLVKIRHELAKFGLAW